LAVSTAGRAPKQNPGIFALAAVSTLGDDEARKVALRYVPRVCRTGTTLMQFCRYREQFGGWGRGARRAVEDWFTEPDVDRVAYQAVKYRQRDGWSMRDLLRLGHPIAETPARRALFNWIINGNVEVSRGPLRASDGMPQMREVGATAEDLPPLVHAFEAAHAEDATVARWVALIGEFPLSWEMLPDRARIHPEVWRALIERGMPQTALIRQLPTLTRAGVLEGATLSTVLLQLTDVERIRKARVHPVNVLIAARTYASGQSVAGKSSWTPKRQIIDALDFAFYHAFQAVEPTNKRILLALDCSASMTWSPISGLPITPRVASAAMALVTLATEPGAEVVGFTADGPYFNGRSRGLGCSISELPISPRQRLDDVVRTIEDQRAGGTDCALPFLWAEANNRDFDAVITYTDNESWAGDIHPFQAKRRYQDKLGHPVRAVAVAMTATDYTVADPGDPLSLDVAGFDSAVPNLISDFARGDV
jgi:60 kDa SS-A/Ro ribonucleoprotein